MTLQEGQQLITILIGILTLISIGIGALVWIFTRRLAAAGARETGKTVELLQTQRDAYKLERDELAAKVPKLEASLATLREEVGARGAIANLELKIAQTEERVVSALQHHEERAQRADQRQAESNRAVIEALNRILAIWHLEPARIETPSDKGR